jgi:peptidoglycan hydrolase-like protein with peptidoglycan-binding domain
MGAQIDFLLSAAKLQSWKTREVTKNKMQPHIILIVALLGSLFVTAPDQVNADTKVMARIAGVETYDGRNLGEDWTGAWVNIRDAKINGAIISRSSFSFEFSGDYGQDVSGIGISSRRTTPSLSPSVAEQINHPDLGNRYWIDAGSIPNLSRLVQSLSRQDQEVVFATCAIMSEPSYVSPLLARMVQDKQGDEVYSAYWRNPSRLSEISRISESCMRQMRRLVQFDEPPQSLAVSPATVVASTNSTSTQSSVIVDKTRTAQSLLATMGYYKSAIDGVSGPGTQRAIQAAMRDLKSQKPVTVEGFLDEVLTRMAQTSVQSDLAKSGQDLRVCEANRVSLKTSLEKCQSDAQGLAAQIADSNEAVGDNSNQSANGLSEAQTNYLTLIATQQLEIEALRGELAGAKSAAGGSNPQELPHDVAQLQQELNEVRRQLEAANKTIVDLQSSTVSSAALTEAQEQRTALSTSIADLQGRLKATQTELEESNRKLTVADEEQSNLTSENASLRSIVVGLNKSIADLQSGLEADARLVDLKKQLDAANTTIAAMQSDSVPMSKFADLESQRAALSQALADQSQSIEADYISKVDHAAALATMQDTELSLRRQLDAVNKSLVDLQDSIATRYISLEEHANLLANSSEIETTLRRQLDAANTTVADLQRKIEIGYVPLSDHNNTLTQLDALNARLVDLQAKLDNEFVPVTKLQEASRLIDSANSTIADLQLSMKNEYRPLADFVQLERQISALNTTILELQERNELQRNRMLESESLFRNFRDDCAASAECKKAMRLE